MNHKDKSVVSSSYFYHQRHHCSSAAKSSSCRITVDKRRRQRQRQSLSRTRFFIGETDRIRILLSAVLLLLVVNLLVDIPSLPTGVSAFLVRKTTTTRPVADNKRPSMIPRITSKVLVSRKTPIPSPLLLQASSLFHNNPLPDSTTSRLGHQNCRLAHSSHTRLFSAKTTSFPDLPPSTRNTTTPNNTLSYQDIFNMDSAENQRIAHYTPYEQWVRRLYMTNLFHPVKLGLQNIEQLYQALGRPLDDVPVIHVAGTNGKGSVVYKLAHTLQSSQNNNKVGMFVSPHISSFRERMQVNGQLITEEEVVELLPQIYQICQEQDIPATFFEITTALAFLFFAKRGVDAVVLETGLGGRLDSTNVLRAPTLAIITSIGLEHTRILGDTIELIALEKGGIIKANRPVLVGPNVPHHVLEPCAQDKQASGYFISNDVLMSVDTEESRNASDESEEITDYDQENARIARAALKLLETEAPQLLEGLTAADIQTGASVRPPCRFEQVPVSMPDDKELTVILDVAHNPPAMEYLVHKLQSTFNGNSDDDKNRVKFRMVVGMSNDKDLNQCWRAVRKAVDDDLSRIHLVEAAHPRAAKLEDIVEAASSTTTITNNGDEDSSSSSYHYDLKDRSVTRQVQNAMQMASTSQETEVLVVCGSVFLMAEAREALGFDEPRDSEYIAEVAGAGSKHGQENFGNSGGITTLPTNKETR